MPIRARYAHTNLIAKDWTRLAAFYQSVFGCEPVPPERDLSGDWLERGTRVPGAHARGAHLRLPGHGSGGPTLEIFQYDAVEDQPDARANRAGFMHLGFHVDDVAEAVAAVVAAGGSVFGEVVQNDVAGAGKVTFTYVKDPEGNLVELQRWEAVVGGVVGRTFAIGDIHGDWAALQKVMARLPKLEATDTLVFLGDYLDRGPDSKEVVDYVRALPALTKAKVVALRGNHEDAWVRVVDEGWIEFIIPRGNGCLETLRSYKGQPAPRPEEPPEPDEIVELARGTFFPPEIVAWMKALPYWYEDEHAIYVHAGLARKDKDGPFPHPSEVDPQRTLLWVRSKDFFRNYRGKTIVFGHTTTDQLPNDMSVYTPDDPNDLWAGPAAIGLDTGAGKGGFLTAIELPKQLVYESR